MNATIMGDGPRYRVARAAAGPRVYLRPPTLRDRDEVLAMNRLSARLYKGLAAPMTSARVFGAYVRRCRRPDYLGLLVCRRDDRAIVGCVNLSQIVRGGFQSAYMGYQVFAPFANQRYMTEALALVLRLVFRTLRLHRVEANIQPGNGPSIALVRRAGFRQEGFSPRYLKVAGRWRDHERWAITVEDWKALASRAAGPARRHR
ncbi:MAG TPA: GNAT family protein [Vicinamibacterales bacterium]|nr:GNAT family protein [Vicinamibacterales bacterium]